jgi:thiol-disulfide isomerase/thioredoxin
VTTVRVLRADGAPVAGARVELLPAASDARAGDHALASVETDAAGAAELTLPGSRTEFLRLRVEIPDGAVVERAIDPRDAALALEIQRATDGERVAAPNSESAALWAAQAIAASWTADQVGRLTPPTPAERDAACATAAAAAAEHGPIAARLRVLYLQFALAQGCGLSVAQVVAAMTDIGPTEPLWALDPSALEASLNYLGRDGGDAAARAAFSEQVIAAHASALLVGELLIKQLMESDDDAASRRLVATLRQPRFAGTAAAAMARAFDPDHLRVGSEVPAFSAVTLDGAAITRDSLRGRPYVMDFWGTWCEGCIEEMPALHAAFAAVHGIARPPRDAAGWRALKPPTGPSRVAFISVAAHDSPEQIAEFRREEWPLPWTNVLDDGSADSPVTRLGIDKFPTVLFVDAGGTIVQRDGDVREGALRLRDAAGPR